MFGKKKAASSEAATSEPAAGAEPAVKAKTKAKSKSKAVKNGHSVNFFAAHAEKLVLGLVVLAAAYLIYDGLSEKGYDPNRQPPQLEQTATKLLNDIRQGDPWPALEKERTIAHDFAKRTDEARMPSDPSLYPVPVMEVQDKGAYEKRGDPQLAAPIRVIGQSVIGLIAVEGPENAIDPFEDFEDADKLETKKKSTRNSRAQAMAAASGMGSEGSAGMTGSPSMGTEGAEAVGPVKRLFPSQYNKGFSIGGIGGGEYGGDMMGSMMGGGGGSMMSGGGTVPSTGGSLTGGPVVKEKKPLAKPILFNAVTALVEHDALVKEYNAKLRESASFMLPRDLPMYLSFEVQRVEITGANQKIEEKDWKTVTDASKQLAMTKSWLPKFPQRVPDVIDPTAFDQALTMPIPPMLIQDYRRFAKHPDIDWAWDAGMSQMQMQMPVPDPTQGMPDPSEGALPGELAGLSAGMGMSGMMGGMGSGMDSGYGTGMSMGYGGDPSGGMSGYGSGYGAGSGYGGESGMGYGMGGMSMMLPKYKMIRFYDQLDPKDVAKTFRYRVRVMMEDPNYPSDRFPAPRPSDMKDDVFARVAKLRQKEDPEAEKIRKENAKLRPGSRPKIYNRSKRFTPWSEPSNAIYVRGPEDVYIGKFAKSAGEPTVEAVLVRLDTQKGAYIPMFSFATEDIKEVRLPPFRRGVVMVFKELAAQFAHPITTVIKQWPSPGYNFAGWSTVVDIRGNDPLAISEKDDPMTEIGEMLMLMGDGRVEVTNEFDDAFWYRGFTLAEEREAAENGTAVSADAMGSMSGGSTY